MLFQERYTRINQKGLFSRSVILKQELKTYSFYYNTNYLDPKGVDPLILKQEIIITVDFNSEIGFTFSFDDLPIEVTSINYNDGLNQFYLELISFIKELKETETKSEVELEYWSVIKKIIENPDSIN